MGATGSEMRIVLNALALRPDGAGVSTYIREVVRAMDPAVRRQLCAVVQSDAVRELPDDVRRRELRPSSGVVRTAVSALAVRDGGIVHGLDVNLPVGRRGPTVTTIQDMAAFDVPWAFSRGRGRGLRAVTRHALRRADVVTAISDFTAERVRAISGRIAVVTPLAAPTDLQPPTDAAVEAARLRYRLPPRFVLHVGTVEPRKEVARLAGACRDEGVPLVVAGGTLGGMTLPDHVQRLGFVLRGDLPSLYGAATSVAYTSVYEGFGLPPLEALSCGAVVLCSRVASLPELLGDAVVWIDPGSSESMRRAVRLGMADEDVRASTRAAAPAALHRTSWRAAAETLEEIYRTLG